MFMQGLILAMMAVQAPAGRGVPVVIQGKPWADPSGPAVWKLLQEGRSSSLQAADTGFRVPAGHRLILREAAFTVSGGVPRAARAAHFQITLKRGAAAFPIAEVTGRLPSQLERATVRHTFPRGLVAPAGAEVCITWHAIRPGGGNVDVAFYGTLAPEVPAP